MDPAIQEIWDSARRVSCVWSEKSSKNIKFEPFEVSSLEETDDEFSEGGVRCEMDIQRGQFPNLRPIDDILEVGEPLSVLIYLYDRQKTMDLMVRDCWAYDSELRERGALIAAQLTDELGCPRKGKLMQGWQKTRNTLNKTNASMLAFSSLSAFRFPNEAQVFLSCNVEICKQQCPRQCSVASIKPLPPNTVVLTTTVSPFSLKSEHTISKQTCPPGFVGPDCHFDETSLDCGTEECRQGSHIPPNEPSLFMLCRFDPGNPLCFANTEDPCILDPDDPSCSEDFTKTPLLKDDLCTFDPDNPQCKGQSESIDHQTEELPICIPGENDDNCIVGNLYCPPGSNDPRCFPHIPINNPLAVHDHLALKELSVLEEIHNVSPVSANSFGVIAGQPITITNHDVQINDDDFDELHSNPLSLSFDQNKNVFPTTFFDKLQLHQLSELNPFSVENSVPLNNIDNGEAALQRQQSTAAKLERVNSEGISNINEKIVINTLPIAMQVQQIPQKTQSSIANPVSSSLNDKVKKNNCSSIDANYPECQSHEISLNAHSPLSSSDCLPGSPNCQQSINSNFQSLHDCTSNSNDPHCLHLLDIICTADSSDPRCIKTGKSLSKPVVPNIKNQKDHFPVHRMTCPQGISLSQCLEIVCQSNPNLKQCKNLMINKKNCLPGSQHPACALMNKMSSVVLPKGAVVFRCSPGSTDSKCHELQKNMDSCPPGSICQSVTENSDKNVFCILNPSRPECRNLQNFNNVACTTDGKGPGCLPLADLVDHKKSLAKASHSSVICPLGSKDPRCHQSALTQNGVTSLNLLKTCSLNFSDPKCQALLSKIHILPSNVLNSCLLGSTDPRCKNFVIPKQNVPTVCHPESTNPHCQLITGKNALTNLPVLCNLGSNDPRCKLLLQNKVTTTQVHPLKTRAKNLFPPSPIIVPIEPITFRPHETPCSPGSANLLCAQLTRSTTEKFTTPKRNRQKNEKAKQLSSTKQDFHQDKDPRYHAFHSWLYQPAPRPRGRNNQQVS